MTSLKAKLVVGMALAAMLASPVAAQMRPGPVTLTTHALRGGVYWVSGGVSNTGFIVGDRGVVVFDPQATAEAGAKALAEIAKVTPKPVNDIIVSHADPDHIGGLPAYPAGTPILMQENTRSEIEVSAVDPAIPPMYVAMYKNLVANFLPTHTLSTSETRELDGVRLEMIHVSPAHTSGDIAVYLPAQKIVFTGDVITTNTGLYPSVHIGGSSLGWIEFTKALLALDADTYVPGHGPMETKAQLRVRLHDAEQRRADIKAMVEAHKTLAEVVQALPEPGENPMFIDYTHEVYSELTQGDPPAAPPWRNIVHR